MVSRPDLRAGAPGEAVRTDPGDDRSLAQLLKELRDESSRLLSQQLALAKAEVTEKLNRAGHNALAIGAGVAVAVVGLLALVTAAAYGVAAALHLNDLLQWPNALWVAWGVVGLATLVIGYVLYQRGMRDLKRQSPVPEKTVQSLKEDQQWLADKTS